MVVKLNELEQYSGDGKKSQKDEDGKVKKEYEKYVLRTMMSRCIDFMEEQSAMEVLLSALSTKQHNGPSIQLLTSPKYHCELAGEGIEFCWGLAKRYYRSITLEKKRTRQMFEKCVRDSIRYVKQHHVSKFSAKCRRYMMAYNVYDGIKNGSTDQLTYEEVERFIKKAKTHRNLADQEKGFIELAWRESN